MSDVKILGKLWFLIPRTQRRLLPLLGLTLFFGALLEVVGISLLVPVLNLLTDERASAENSVFEPLFRFFDARSQFQMLTVGCLSLGLMMLIKNTYLACSAHFQSVQTSAVRHSIETRMFHRYLFANYRFHLDSNGSTLSRNLITEVEIVANGIFVPAFTIAVEGLAVVGVMLLLMWVEPIPTLILLLFFILCSIFYLRLVSPLLSRLGHDRASYAGETFKIVSETLGGIKEIKVFYRENFFWERFRTNSRRALKVSARRETMNRVPAYLVELWGVLGLLLVIFSLLFQNENTQEVVTSLGLFVGASLRLIPSLNRVLISLQSLKLAKPAVDIVFRELTDDLEFRQPEEVVHFSTQLSFCKVTFSYTSVSEPVIKDASFNLMRGESVGIIGPSGTGKSTLIAILLGLLKPTSGQIIIDGQAIDSNKHLWQTQIAYVPQEIFLLDDTIRNNIAFGVSRDDVSSKKLMQSIEAAQLSDFVATLPSGLDTVVGERGVRLSGGQRQRIGLARALYFEPTVLVLDEATSALDSATETGVLRTLESLRPGVTMIFVSHRPSTLIFCDRKFRLNDGELTEIA